MKPLIGIDIDGVLNPDGMSNSRAKTMGYRLSRRIREEMMNRTFWDRRHGTWLRQLAEDHDGELVWATYWNDLANRYAGPEVGLPQLPVVHFDLDDYLRDWKYPAMLAYAQGRPLVWFDDEHSMHIPERDAFLAARTEPTKLISVVGTEGLGELELSIARRFLESL